MENRYYMRKSGYYTIFPVLLGNMLGSLLILLAIAFLDTVIPEQGIENYHMGVLLNLPSEELCLHMIKRRGIQLIFFLVIAVFLSYPVAAVCYNGIFGIYYGLITCDLFIKFGFRGMIYSVVCFFPHYLFYFFAIFLGEYWFCQSQSKYPAGYENVNKPQKMVKIFVIIFFLFIALIWEIKFQKKFLNYFYQYIV